MVLILLGCGWGLTIPLTVIAVTTGLGHLGIIFWQFFIVMVLFGVRQIFLKNEAKINQTGTKRRETGSESRSIHRKTHVGQTMLTVMAWQDAAAYNIPKVDPIIEGLGLAGFPKGLQYNI